MPVIPMDVQREVTQATPAAPMQSLAEAGRLGQSLAQFGSAADAFQQEQDARSAADTKLKLHTFSAEFKESLAKDADYSTYETRYKDAVAKWKEQNVYGLTSGAKRMLGAGLDEAITQGGVQIRHAARLQQVDQSKAELMSSLDQARQGFGRAGGDMGAVLADGYKAIDVRLQGGVLTHVEAERQREAFRNSIADEQARMMFMSDPRGFAAALEKGGHEWLGGERRLMWQQRAESRADTLEARARARAEAAERQRMRVVADELREIRAITSEGYDVAPERLETAGKLAIGTPYEAELRGILTARKAVGDFALRPIQQQRAALAAAEASLHASGAPNAATIDALKMMRSTMQHAEKALASEPLEHAERTGLEQPIPPIDLSDPTSIAARVATGKRVAAFHDLAVVPVLKKHEAGAVVAQLEKTKDPRARFQALDTLLQAGGDTAGAAILDQLEAAGMSKGVRLAMEAGRGDAFKGGRLLSELRVKPSDVSLAKEDDEKIKRESADAYQSRLGKVRAEQARITGNAAFLEMADRERDTAAHIAKVRAAAGGVDAGVGAVAELLPRVGVYVENLAAITVPENESREAVVSGLRYLRQKHAADFAQKHVDEIRQKLGHAQSGGDPVLASRAARMAEEIAGRGVWIDQGDGYALVTPWGHGALTEPLSKKVWTITPQDAVTAHLQMLNEQSMQVGTMVP